MGTGLAKIAVQEGRADQIHSVYQCSMATVAVAERSFAQRQLFVVQKACRLTIAVLSEPIGLDHLYFARTGSGLSQIPDLSSALVNSSGGRQEERPAGQGWAQVMPMEMTVQKQPAAVRSPVFADLARRPAIPSCSVAEKMHQADRTISGSRSRDLEHHEMAHLVAETANCVEASLSCLAAGSAREVMRYGPVVAVRVTETPRGSGCLASPHSVFEHRQRRFD